MAESIKKYPQSLKVFDIFKISFRFKEGLREVLWSWQQYIIC